MVTGISIWGYILIVMSCGLISTLVTFCLIKIFSNPGRANNKYDSAGKRAQWGSRIGLVLAMAGNAIGLGNFLRFPVHAAGNGGGAFLIPYFLAFIFLGLPLM